MGAAANVRLVQRLLREYPPPPDEMADWLSQLCHPYIDFFPAPKIAGARRCRGIAETAAYLNSTLESWDSYKHTIHQVRPIGDDRVLAHITMDFAGRQSGVSITADLYECYWIFDGRLKRIEDHLTERGALAALAGMQTGPEESVI